MVAGKGAGPVSELESGAHHMHGWTAGCLSKKLLRNPSASTMAQIIRSPLACLDPHIQPLGGQPPVRAQRGLQRRQLGARTRAQLQLPALERRCRSVQESAASREVPSCALASTVRAPGTGAAWLPALTPAFAHLTTSPSTPTVLLSTGDSPISTDNGSIRTVA